MKLQVLPGSYSESEPLAEPIRVTVTARVSRPPGPGRVPLHQERSEHYSLAGRSTGPGPPLEVQSPSHGRRTGMMIPNLAASDTFIGKLRLL